MKFLYGYENFLNACIKQLNEKKVEGKEIAKFQNIYIINEFLRKYENNLVIQNGRFQIFNNIFLMIKRGRIRDVNERIIWTISKIKDFNEEKDMTLEEILESVNHFFYGDIQFLESFITNTNNINNKLYPKRIDVVQALEHTNLLIPVVYKGINTLNKRGVYFIYDKDKEIAYIGKSNSSVLDRAMHSTMERRLKDFSKIEIFLTDSEYDTDLHEINCIKTYKPYLNIADKDGDAMECKELNPSQILIELDQSEHHAYTYKTLRIVTSITLEFLKRNGNDLYFRNPENIAMLNAKGFDFKYESERRKKYENALSTIKNNYTDCILVKRTGKRGDIKYTWLKK